MSKLLGSLKVVELGQVIAGPYAGAILADLGAEVIKIERHRVGDDARHMGEAVARSSALMFHVFNRGKQSKTIDIKSVAGREELEALIAGADVFLHNLRPDVPGVLGLDGPSLCRRHPRLIYCQISAFGETGPYATRPGYEPLIQAFSGLSSINGGPDDPPMRAGASICDQGAGMWSVIGILTLLHRRQHTGRGGIVSTSLLETALAWIAQRTDTYVNLGHLLPRDRSGHPSFVPYQAFDTTDGSVLICCGNDRLFEKLAQVLGHTEWVTDPRFSTNVMRLSHKAELIPLISDIIATRSTSDWVDVFLDSGVPCSPINDIPAIVRDSQAAALKMRAPLGAEGLELTLLPLRIDGDRPRPTDIGPSLGASNSPRGG